MFWTNGSDQLIKKDLMMLNPQRRQADAEILILYLRGWIGSFGCLGLKGLELRLRSEERKASKELG